MAARLTCCVGMLLRHKQSCALEIQTNTAPEPICGVPPSQSQEEQGSSRAPMPCRAGLRYLGVQKVFVGPACLSRKRQRVWGLPAAPRSCTVRAALSCVMSHLSWLFKNTSQTLALPALRAACPGVEFLGIKANVVILTSRKCHYWQLHNLGEIGCCWGTP